MFNWVVVGSIGRGGDKMEILESGLFGEFSFNDFPLVPLGIIPDHTDFLIRILLHELSQDNEGLYLIAPFDWINTTLTRLLIEESQIVLVFFAPLGFNDGSLAPN